MFYNENLTLPRRLLRHGFSDCLRHTQVRRWSNGVKTGQHAFCLSVLCSLTCLLSLGTTRAGFSMMLSCRYPQGRAGLGARGQCGLSSQSPASLLHLNNAQNIGSLHDKRPRLRQNLSNVVSRAKDPRTAVANRHKFGG